MTPPTFVTDTTIGLYIHIPFCESLCPYCNFFKHRHDPTRDARSQLVQAIQQELIAYQTHYPDLTIQSIYFGGGTPSTLQPEHWLTLLNQIQSAWPLANTCELTIEMDPLHITPDWLAVLEKQGPMRVSMGAQSSDATVLKHLGRRHTWPDVMAAVERVRSLSTVSIGLDLMFGMPQLTPQRLAGVLNDYAQLGIDHVSTYGLTLEPGTPFYATQTTRSDDAMADDYDQIFHALTAAGFDWYERSAFAKPGHASIHNQGYWQFRPYLGVGPSAHSFFQGQRFRTISQFQAYCQSPVRSVPKRPIDYGARFEEWLMVGLRTRAGVSLAQGQQWFGINLEENSSVIELIQSALLVLEHGRLVATYSGRHVLDSVIEQIVFKAEPVSKP
ncbi:radical SAM family heme chaperone HemW [Candidatus Marinamargulisbacteria bacterium]|nr:radical SAM family heme chaperone HemW [Candidatus Marinamargulisbacteria bacterium]